MKTYRLKLNMFWFIASIACLILLSVASVGQLISDTLFIGAPTYLLLIAIGTGRIVQKS